MNVYLLCLGSENFHKVDLCSDQSRGDVLLGCQGNAEPLIIPVVAFLLRSEVGRDV